MAAWHTIRTRARCKCVYGTSSHVIYVYVDAYICIVRGEKTMGIMEKSRCFPIVRQSEHHGKTAPSSVDGFAPISRRMLVTSIITLFLARALFVNYTFISQPVEEYLDGREPKTFIHNSVLKMLSYDLHFILCLLDFLKTFF
jgi:hypothetical protein